MSASPTAYLALILFVPLCGVAFAVMRPVAAAIGMLLCAVLFLPEGIGFDAPGLPPIDKYTLATLVVGVGCLVNASRIKNQKSAQSKLGRHSSHWIFAAGLLLFAGAVGTILGNRDSVVLGPKLVAPGLGVRDLISEYSRLSFWLIGPFLIGRLVIRSADSVSLLFKWLAGAGVFYSLFMLLEIRLSPQLNVWLYGYHQHSWQQVVRDGGFRPVVFMAHGLAVAMFTLAACFSGVLLARSKERLFDLPVIPFVAYLYVVLILTKSLGAIAYATTLAPVAWFFKPKAVTRMALLLAALALLYPLLRVTGWFPDEALVDFFARIDNERAGSLKFRFDNETALIEKWLERPWFGWGGYGRSRIYDPEGHDISVTDGEWIIALGTFGLARYIAEFGLLVGPVLMAAQRLRYAASERERVLVAGLALLVAVSTLDLLPNGLFSFLPVFFAGALLGAVEGLRTRSKVAADRAFAN
jgi:hypothetical protein